MMTNDLSYDDKYVFFSNFVIDSRQTDFRFAVDKLIDRLLTKTFDTKNSKIFIHFHELTCAKFINLTKYFIEQKSNVTFMK